jgi:hypothetical protein
MGIRRPIKGNGTSEAPALCSARSLATMNTVARQRDFRTREDAELTMTQPSRKPRAMV